MYPSQQSHPLIGVRGWLLFLCLVLVVFIPIGVTMELVAVWRRARLMPELQDLVVTAIDVGMVVLAIVAGLLLYRLRRTGVWLAEIFFALRLLIAAVAALERQTAEAGLAIIVSLAWLIYLFTSERVRRTYPAQSTRISEIFH